MSQKWLTSAGLLVVFTIAAIAAQQIRPRYDPTWESLESRPLPTWFDDSKIGIFIHWGVFSVPGFGSEWFWYNWHEGSEGHVDFMKNNYPPQFTYQDFGPQFTAEFYDPSKWADLFKKSGAKYVVLTSKHHEGYTLWPSKYSFSWNAMDVGAKRDLLGDLATAIRDTTDLRFGLYHSLYEWYNPLYLSDKANEFRTDEFVQTKTLPELYEIVNAYKPDIVWSDGNWEASEDYWKSKEFLAWLYTDSPVADSVVTNDRWGNTTMCAHGGYFNCDDGYNPGHLPPYKWENCRTLDKNSWGIRRNAQIGDYLTPEELIKVMIETVSCGGNLLLNVGPTKEGVIVPVQEERLLQLGEWLGVNGDAIYGSKPWTAQNDSLTAGVWYTSKPEMSRVFAVTLNWPGQQPLHLGSVDPSSINSIGLLGHTSEITWTSASPEPGIKVNFPRPDQVQSKWAWTLVINQK